MLYSVSRLALPAGGSGASKLGKNRPKHLVHIGLRASMDGLAAGLGDCLPCGLGAGGCPRAVGDQQYLGRRAGFAAGAGRRDFGPYAGVLPATGGGAVQSHWHLFLPPLFGDRRLHIGDDWRRQRAFRPQWHGWSAALLERGESPAFSPAYWPGCRIDQARSVVRR